MSWIGLIPLAAIAAVFAVMVAARPGIERRRPVIVVVDRLTYRIALERVDQAEADDNPVRALAGLTAARLWLRDQVRFGRKRRRARYAADLEQVELRLERLRETISGA
jgi:hypothetical protein